jgi:aminomethyltransferase
VASDAQILRRTALYDRHVAAGARLTPFAGWEMPVRYGSIVDEHLAVRRSCGVFDVSHMGEIACSGPGAADFLAHVLSNDPRSLAVGESLYAVLCTPQGGVIDDGITYRLGAEQYLTVTNAANHETDFAWFEEHVDGFDVDVSDAAVEYAMLAVQGPRARAILGELAGGQLPARKHASTVSMLGHDVLFCGTGYTGEDGGELLLAPEHAPTLWDALLAAGVVPVGLGARDTLRTEACLALYGNELTLQRNPIEAGLGWCCTEASGFIGSAIVAAVRAAGPTCKLVAFTLDGRGIARQGDPVVDGGVVTSGTMSPVLDVGIGMAYLPADRARVGERFQIDVRGTLRDAVVASRPLVSPTKES